MKFSKLLLAMAASGIATSAFATNGYFAHGYGMKEQSMGGVGIAIPMDGLAAATNPAGMVMVGNTTDLGLTWFNPVRQATVGTTLYKSHAESFAVPEFGYNRMLDQNSSFGVSVFGNGGMNTSYDTIAEFGSGEGTRTGVNLTQLFISPTYSKKISEKTSIGVSLNIAHQKFAAYGIGNFSGQSDYGSNLSNKGFDDSTGFGVRLGWLSEVKPGVTVGATYQSRTYMSNFDKYKGLFAEQGDFDIPQNYGVGIAIQATPKTKVAFDIVKIDYSTVKAIANTMQAYTGAKVMDLGSDHGAGFGWTDQTVFKLGMSHAFSDKLVIRAGYNHGDSPLKDNKDSSLAFNILAPATVEDHVTLGLTWNPDKNGELNVAFMHALSNSVSTASSAGTGVWLGGVAVDTKMKQNSLGVSYSWKL